MTDRSTQAPPPQQAMMQLLFGKQLTYCLSGLARLGVADHMSASPMPVEEIAAKVGAHAPSLYRVMRLLASVGVFKEEPPRHFALTPSGELLKSEVPGTVRYFAMMFGDEWTTRAYEYFTSCLRTGQDGVSQAYGKDVFELLAERPEQLATFQAAMTSGSTLAGDAITQAYDFSFIKRLADVGGGTARCSQRFCGAIRTCKAYCSIAPRLSRACPKTGLSAARGGSPSRAAASSNACRTAATLIS
jgi:hypothetical protein